MDCVRRHKHTHIHTPLAIQSVSPSICKLHTGKHPELSGNNRGLRGKCLLLIGISLQTVEIRESQQKQLANSCSNQ